MPVDVTSERAKPAPSPHWTQRWWFRLLLLAAALAIPPVVASPLDPRDIPALVAEVLQNPMIVQVPVLLPLAKLFAVTVLLAAWWSTAASARVLLAGYAAALVVVAVFQEIGSTPSHGWAWLVGNTMLMLVVAARCLWDLATHATPAGPRHLDRGRLWVLAPMLLAFLMPYAVDASGSVQPSVGWHLLTNEAAVTYCMVTPVVIGALLLYAGPVSRPTLSLSSFVGLYFGLLNLVMWWVMQPNNWWMGVLHVPLVILAAAGLIEAHAAPHRVVSGGG